MFAPSRPLGNGLYFGCIEMQAVQSTRSEFEALEVLDGAEAVEFLGEIHHILATPGDCQHAFCLGKGRGQRSVECGSAHETIFNQLQLDFLLAKHLAKLRGLLSVELSKADDNHVANVIETALEVVNQHVLDEFAH